MRLLKTIHSWGVLPACRGAFWRQIFEGMLLAFSWPGWNARHPKVLKTPFTRKNSQDGFGMTSCTSCVGKPSLYLSLELTLHVNTKSFLYILKKTQFSRNAHPCKLKLTLLQHLPMNLFIILKHQVTNGSTACWKAPVFSGATTSTNILHMGVGTEPPCLLG